MRFPRVEPLRASLDERCRGVSEVNSRKHVSHGDDQQTRAELAESIRKKETRSRQGYPGQITTGQNSIATLNDLLDLSPGSIPAVHKHQSAIGVFRGVERSETTRY